MIHKIFTIYDEKAKAYYPPFYLHQTGMAVRIFSDMVNDPQNKINKHPSDYTLFDIGTFNDNTALIVAHTAESVHNGVELINPTEEGTVHEISNDTSILTGTEG